jgi:hypothetical protein
MATATKNYNAWDLSSGMDVDYSGSAERKKADEEYARAQKIIADAYEMDSYSATAQSNANKTNAENQAYLNTIDAKTNALNAENLLNTSINTDKQATLDAVNNFERFFSEEQRIPVTVSNQTSTEQNVVDTAVTNVNETATPQTISELPNNNKNVNKQNNAQGAIVQNTAVQNTAVESVLTKNQQVPQQPLTRQRTNLEVLQAVELRATGKVLYEVQKRIKQEHINNAAGSAYYNPMASLDALRKAGVSVPIQLQNTGDGNYIQTLPDGKSINLTRLDVGVMVNDIIYSTRDMMKRDETAINDAKTQKAKQIEEQRKFENDLLKYDAQNKIDLSNRLIELEVQNDYGKQQKAYEDSISNKNTPTGQRTLPANMLGGSQPMSNMDFLAKKESGGDYKKMQANGGGYVGRYQFGAASLVEAGLVSREKLAAANPTKKGFNQREFLENQANWTNGNSLETFLNTPSMQDKAYSQKQAAETKQIINILKSRGDKTYEDPAKVQALVNAAHLVGVGGIDKDGEPTGVMGFFKNGRFTGDVKDGNGTKASTYYADTLANIQQNNQQLNKQQLLLPAGVERPNNLNIASSSVPSQVNRDLKIPSITKELGVLDLQLKRAGDALIVNKDRELKNELRKTIEELKSKRILLGKSLKNEQEKIGYEIYKQSSDKQSKEQSQEYKNKKQEISNKVKAILEGTQ